MNNEEHPLHEYRRSSTGQPNLWSRYLWWHRLRHHDVEKIINVLSPWMSTYYCNTCEKVWRKSYL